MTHRSFLVWPDRRLRAVAARVAVVDDEVRAIWDEMLDAMYAMPGVGLAAPQLGVMRALAVVDCSGKRAPVYMANPELVWASQDVSAQTEGSPNLPGIWAEVQRPAHVRVRYLDQDGAEREQVFGGLWATSVQHQIDHLGGHMFFDRLGAVKRRMLLAKHDKVQRRGGRG